MKISEAAGAVVAPKILKSFRFSWLVYGAAAYFGIRYLNKRGILPKQTGAALGMIDQGIDYAKSQLGFESERKAEPRALGLQNEVTH